METLRINTCVMRSGFLEKGYLNRLLSLTHFQDKKLGVVEDYQLKIEKNLVITHEISQYDSKNPKGLGIWPDLYKFQHSCQPNCSYTYLKNSLIISAAEKIPKNTSLTIDYVAYQCCRERRTTLKKQFNITCMCSTCQWTWWPGNVEEYLEIIEIAQNLENK